MVSHDLLAQAAEILRSGGLVAFPTETVYGLGADAYNPLALAKVFEVKARPHFDPLIIHIASIDTLEIAANLSLLSEVSRLNLSRLAENLWPGPLSIVLPKSDKVSGLATAGLPTAAFCFPDHEIAQKLISLSSGAVAAPSANPFGSLSPTKAEHVRNKLGDKIDMILDGGSTRVGLESTVLDITGDCIKILRPGGTPKEVIESLVGPVQIINKDEIVDKDLRGHTAPGQLKSHYAPKMPLFALDRKEIVRQPYKNGDVFLFFDSLTKDEWVSSQNPPNSAVIRVLSEAGNLPEAASRLFETLHELENSNILQIYAQFAPAEGLGEAINDRLRRAST